MKNEYQYKFHIKNKNIFVAKLKAKNILLSDFVNHKYTYFESPKKENNIFIVLRIKESQDKKAIDIKIRNNENGQWGRFESKIDNSEQMKNILEKIGCKIIFIFHKTRQTFDNDFIRIDLDVIKELGTFLEVKFLADNKKKAEQFLIDLGVDLKEQDKRSIIEIYLSGQK